MKKEIYNRIAIETSREWQKQATWWEGKSDGGSKREK